ncbi:MAG TPA: phosphotransferase [Patescibacteria group bacterium]|nr:phosphotransferase [Patescibacteria group bacterium]
MNSTLLTPWDTIEASLQTLAPTSGGYTTAQRGIITSSDSQRLFVKIGHDDLTKEWAHKEILVYRFLQKHAYPFVPKLVAVNSDETAFALEPLQDTWDWSDTWTTERLDKTLEAMDALAVIIPDGHDCALFEKSFVSETADGWRPLADDTELQGILRTKLVAAGRQDLVDTINFGEHAQRSSEFMFERTALVHNDVRADNCAWNKAQQTVKLIDWNWTQLGDRRTDVGALLVHVHKTGFDITNYIHRLDKEALHWLAGFWFRSASQPLLEGGSERAALRDYQLASGVTAFDLAQQI